MTQPQRQLPAIEATTRFFWEGGRDGRLLIQKCECGHYQHPPLPRCRACGSERLAPAAVSGKGHVASFTINRQSWLPGLEPYVFAAVALVEQDGLHVFTNICDCPLDRVTIGMPVEVMFDQQDDVWLPLFRPAGEADD